MKNDAAYYESAYNPRLAVPEYASHFERWRKKAKQARDTLSGYLDVPYGPHPMEKLDIFRAIVPPAAAALHRLDVAEPAFPKTQHVLGDIEVVRDLADGAECVGRLVQSRLAPSG